MAEGEAYLAADMADDIKGIEHEYTGTVTLIR
jgi:hypothetical protein